MARQKYGILFIDISDDDVSNGEITLESAIANKRDSIVELIKNPYTTKLIYLKIRDNIIGYPIRISNNIKLTTVTYDADGVPENPYMLLLHVENNKITITEVDNL